MSEKWSVERDFVSPEVLDALICYGRNALHYPEQEDLCPTNDRCLAIVRENQDRLERLADGLNGLLERIDPAVDFLEHLKPFDIQSETEIIDDGLLADSSGDASLRAHLRALDDFVYSCYSLESSSFFADDRFTGLRAEAVQAVHDLADRMLALPLWKLIPVNTQRQLVLHDIPEEHRFRFPWYEQDSDLPEDALYLLAWRWAGNAPEQEPLPWEEQLSREVQADPTYSAHLQRMASLLRELPKAFASAHALAWEFHADLLGSRHPLPEWMTDREGIYV
ncbi:MAG: hypothetical protein EOM65_16730, partial [Synergistales bacterium]|nr:hypothetical protein [Synergistales bacterium]